MRTCSGCEKADAPWFEDAACTCGAPPELAADPAQHRPDCRCLGHEVVTYPVRITKSDLWRDAGGEPHISAYYTGRGWKLKTDGQRFYRVKMLCRNCIALEVDALARKREYERACRATRGEDNKTYAQMLAQQ